MYKEPSVAGTLGYIWGRGIFWGAIAGGFYGALIAPIEGMSAALGTILGVIFGCLSGCGTGLFISSFTVFVIRNGYVRPLTIMIRSGLITLFAFWIILFVITGISPFKVTYGYADNGSVLFSILPGVIAAIVSAIICSNATNKYYTDVGKRKRKNDENAAGLDQNTDDL